MHVDHPAAFSTSSISLLNFFKPIDSLPTAEQTGLPSNVVSAANRAVEKTLRGSDGDDDHKRPRKYTTMFTSEDRAKLGQYAAQNGVVRARRHFQSINLSER